MKSRKWYGSIENVKKRAKPTVHKLWVKNGMSNNNVMSRRPAPNWTTIGVGSSITQSFTYINQLHRSAAQGGISLLHYPSPLARPAEKPYSSQENIADQLCMPVRFFSCRPTKKTSNFLFKDSFNSSIRYIGLS